MEPLLLVTQLDAFPKGPERGRRPVPGHCAALGPRPVIIEYARARQSLGSEAGRASTVSRRCRRLKSVHNRLGDVWLNEKLEK